MNYNKSFLEVLDDIDKACKATELKINEYSDYMDKKGIDSKDLPLEKRYEFEDLINNHIIYCDFLRVADSLHNLK